MSFLIKDDKVWDKYDKIWDVIKDKLGINFHSEPVYEYRYLKAKVREFDGVMKTNFLGDDVPKENMYEKIRKNRFRKFFFQIQILNLCSETYFLRE